MDNNQQKLDELISELQAKIKELEKRVKDLEAKVNKYLPDARFK